MSQINGIDPLGLHGNLNNQSPLQNLENGNPMQSAFDWYQWNLYNGDLASQTLYPGIAQYSEWSQQMVTQMYQNWWNSEQERMQRGIAAGINPYLLANGIAGTSFPSVSAPPSAVGSGANSVNSLANLGSSLFSGAKNVTDSYAQMAKLRSEINKIDSDTERNFVEMGFSKLQSKSMSIALRYMDEKEQISVYQALANFNKTKEEYNVLRAQYNNELARYDEIIANKDLLIAQKGEVEALKEVHDAEAASLRLKSDWQRIENQFFNSHHYKLGSPIFESMRDSIVEDSPYDIDGVANVIAGYDSKIFGAQYNAQSAASWSSRPSNAFEMSVWAGGFLGKSLRDLILNSTDSSSLLNALSKVSNKDEYAEFNDAFDDAKTELYNNYRHYRKLYRQYRRSSASDSTIAEYRQKMLDAKKEYDSFTKEKFSESLIKNISPR